MLPILAATRPADVDAPLRSGRHADSNRRSALRLALLGGDHRLRRSESLLRMGCAIARRCFGCIRRRSRSPAAGSVNATAVVSGPSGRCWA
jgi:hypothetical protein